MDQAPQSTSFAIAATSVKLTEYLPPRSRPSRMEQRQHGDGIYVDGPLSISFLELAVEAPRPLLVAAPSSPGADAYPVVLLQHGFALQNGFYSQLMKHVASHGYVVVAPQMYKRVAGPDASEEIAAAASIVEWIAARNLDRVAAVDHERFAIVGHSRGGKVAFGMALGLAPRPLALRLSALVALDPVDGTSDAKQTPPPILKFQPDCLQLGCPALILGAGLGCERRNFIVPPCAPERVGHRAFFSDCAAPVFLLRAPGHGHMDFLDDDTGGSLAGRLTYAVCKNGPSRSPMRRLAGGLIVAFLHRAFGRGAEAFQAALDSPPSLFEKPQIKEREL